MKYFLVALSIAIVGAAVYLVGGGPSDPKPQASAPSAAAEADSDVQTDRVKDPTVSTSPLAHPSAGADPALTAHSPLPWAEISRWWTHGGLLRAKSLPRPGWTEGAYILTKGSPSRPGAAVKVWYHYGNDDPRVVSACKIDADGGISFQWQYWEPGLYSPKPPFPWTDDEVTVRGRPAIHSYQDDGSCSGTFRYIHQLRNTEEGGTVVSTFWAHPDHYDFKALKAIIEAAVPVD